MSSNIIIENHTAIWDMPLTQGEVLGTYSGRFVFKCYLSPLDQIAANKLYRELVGSHSSIVSEHEGLMAFTLTQLKYRIVKAPPFWLSHTSEYGISGNIPDLNVLSLILNHALESEELFKKNMIEQRKSVLTRTITVAEEILKADKGEE